MKKTKWNENWCFWEMYNSFALLWDVPKDAVKVKLPHDAMLQHRAYAESSLGGNSGYRDGGHFCYSKELQVEEDKQAKYMLQFDGVYENAAVYVNGNLLLRHPYGYTPFLADLTSYLETGKNEIRVMTNNKAPSGRWYTGGGIYRDVYLLTSERPVYLMPDGVRIRTESIDSENRSAKLQIRAAVKNDMPSAAEVKLKFRILPSQEIWSEVVTVEGRSEKQVCIRADLPDPVLWSEENPGLSICETTLLCKEQETFVPADFCESRFGIRMFHLDPEHGFRINGKCVKLRGACIHADNGLMGTAEIRDAVYRKIRILKEAGFNAIRMSHHPASSVLLDVCDELGMLVMNEAFDMWTRNKTDYDYANYFEDWWERDIEALVGSSYNHPCVFMYSLGNEIPEIGIRRGREICSMLQKKVKSLDDTRYTTVAVNGPFSVGDILPEIVKDVLGTDGGNAADGNVNEFLAIMDNNIDKIVVHDIISERVAKAAQLVDACGYNYMTGRYEKDVKEYPDRVIVGSETYPSYMGRIWEMVEKHTQIIGDFTWTGWDYIGEAGVAVPAYKPREGGFGAIFPCQLANTGDMDITGFRRPASHIREMVYGLRKDPVIAVKDPAHFEDRVIVTPWVVTTGIQNWNYPGMEGKPVSVEVYSPGDEVELYLNERSLGRQSIPPAFEKVEYQTVYERGTLRAVAYQNGDVIGESVLETPQEQSRLCAGVEAQFAELTYIEIARRDAQGLVDQACAETIHVSTEGALESWLGTGNPKPSQNYTDQETTLWNGRALLIVRKNHPDDRVAITISDSRETLNLIV